MTEQRNLLLLLLNSVWKKAVIWLGSAAFFFDIGKGRNERASERERDVNHVIMFKFLHISLIAMHEEEEEEEQEEEVNAQREVNDSNSIRGT